MFPTQDKTEILSIQLRKEFLQEFNKIQDNIDNDNPSTYFSPNKLKQNLEARGS